MAVAGRKVRWSLSTDGGTTYTPFGGSTSDGFSFTREAIDVTDKDDSGWRTLLPESGSQSAEGTATLWVEDLTIPALILNNTSELQDLKFEVEGLFDCTGSFFLSSFNPSGEEGASAATYEVTFMSSGPVTYTPA